MLEISQCPQNSRSGENRTMLCPDLPAVRMRLCGHRARCQVRGVLVLVFFDSNAKLTTASLIVLSGKRLPFLGFNEIAGFAKKAQLFLVFIGELALQR